VGEAQEGKGFRLALSFGSTGQFYTQITKDAPFEVFVAADDERPHEGCGRGVRGSGKPVHLRTGGIQLSARLL
jgi:molybdate transport system substrate-binding protein